MTAWTCPFQEHKFIFWKQNKTRDITRKVKHFQITLFFETPCNCIQIVGAGKDRLVITFLTFSDNKKMLRQAYFVIFAFSDNK